MTPVHPLHGLFHSDGNEEAQANGPHMNEKITPTMNAMLRRMNFQGANSRERPTRS
jgi:hypothetical protein